MRALLFIVVLLWAWALAGKQAYAQHFGTFEGQFRAEWLPDGRSMKLLDAVTFLAPDGSSWIVPKDTVVDGASIPGALWSFIGGPFSGKYRNASVIHDYYCETKSRPWREVHKAFFLASRANGVGVLKARIMYYAVYRFGPRWEKSRSGDGSVIVFKPKFRRDEFVAARRAIEQEAMSIEDIEREADRRLRSQSRSIIE